MQPDSPRDKRLGGMLGTYLGRVVDVADPDDLCRVKVRLLVAPEDLGDGDCAVWARVAAPFAGAERGAFFLPDVDDEVAVVFVGGDPRQPLVVGGLWSGAARAPDRLGGAGDRVDRYTITGKKGSRIAVVEEAEGRATLTLKTPGQESVTITQESGGKITLAAGMSTVTIDTNGVSLETGSKVKVQASQVEVTAGSVQVNAAMASFSGVVKAEVVQATTVVATTYTPGAGNVW